MAKQKKQSTSKKATRPTGKSVVAKANKPTKRPSAQQAAAFKQSDTINEPSVAIAELQPQIVEQSAPLTDSVSGIAQVSSLRQRLWPYAWGAGPHRLFAWACLVVLGATTVFWSLLSARLHQANADQLIDTYLFENLGTFQGASFPGAHTFLMKWPIFALTHLYGTTPGVFMGVTVLMTLATVAALAYVLYRIERRPVVFGLLCLALSSVLLLVPAQPYPGALLPVNMAMTTTRNLEYVLYIAALYLAVRMPRLRHKLSVAVLAAIGLVIASDKLFIALAVGSAVFAIVWYALRRYQRLAVHALRWLAIVACAVVVSLIGLKILNATGLTNVYQEQSTSPYPFVHSAKQLAVGLTYGAAAVATNFGANPVHAVTIINDLPAAALKSLRQPSNVGYFINGVVLLVALFAALRVLFGRLDGAAARLAVLLVGSTLTAGVVFVVTDHYYPVDARYLTIGLFALAVCAAVYGRSLTLRRRYIAAAAFVLVLSLPFGLNTAWNEYQTSQTAMAPKTKVTADVSSELQRRKITRLAGNYWDVTPVKAAKPGKLTIMPLSGCTAPAKVLTSSAWFNVPAKTPAAYLAVKDDTRAANRETTGGEDTSGPLATYDGCSLQRIVGWYGPPTDRVVIKPGANSIGAAGKPEVLLLLYANGVNPAKAVDPITTPPAAPEAPEGPRAFAPFSDRDGCKNGTILQVVAHQDDDLLFMSPDLIRAITAGKCIRTVFMTAGDAGTDVKYWGNRELGAKAAYAEMYKVKNDWHEEQQVLNGQKVSINYLTDVPTVSLVFFRLPDGNLHGSGFAARNYESMTSLLSGKEPLIRAVDGSASYSSQQLQDALLDIMIKDLPSDIRTQSSNNQADGDHADHHAVGTITDRAAARYLQQHSVTHYLGYPGKERPANISDDDFTLKQAAFLTYAKFDGAVCQSAFECQNTYTYGRYLGRQYQP